MLISEFDRRGFLKSAATAVAAWPMRALHAQAGMAPVPSLLPISLHGTILRLACSSILRRTRGRTRRATISLRRSVKSILTSIPTTGPSARLTWARSTSCLWPSTRAASACGRPRPPNTASAAHRGKAARATCSKIFRLRARSVGCGWGCISRRATGILARAWAVSARMRQRRPNTTRCIASSSRKC